LFNGTFTERDLPLLDKAQAFPRTADRNNSRYIFPERVGDQLVVEVCERSTSQGGRYFNHGFFAAKFLKSAAANPPGKFWPEA
jgi:hypothetical protein